MTSDGLNCLTQVRDITLLNAETLWITRPDRSTISRVRAIQFRGGVQGSRAGHNGSDIPSEAAGLHSGEERRSRQRYGQETDLMGAGEAGRGLNRPKLRQLDFRFLDPFTGFLASTSVIHLSQSVKSMVANAL